jgi:OCT family organic cation transporter-like MFS transporter 4/5
MGIAVQLGWATGYIMLPAMAYYFDNFRHLLLACAVPEIVWLVWLFFIPESPRWLLTHDRNERAESIILRAVEMNGGDPSLVPSQFKILKETIDREREAVTSGDSGQSFLDLWKSKLMILYSIIFYISWFTNAFVYYGISLNIGDLGGDLFWNFFWAGLVEFPSYFFCMFAFRIIGRRPLLAAMMFGAGVSCLAIVPFYATNNTTSSWILVFAMFGKFCITCSFGIIYVYSAEVYPTVLRQIGVGSCSVAGRVGSIIAPFVKELSLYTNFGVSMAIFGCLSIATALVSIKLPETKDKDIPDTIEDVEKLRLKR